MDEAASSFGLGKRAGDGEWAFLIPPPVDVAESERPRAWECCWSMGRHRSVTIRSCVWYEGTWLLLSLEAGRGRLVDRCDQPSGDSGSAVRLCLRRRRAWDSGCYKRADASLAAHSLSKIR
jgi:hypothetical protein